MPLIQVEGFLNLKQYKVHFYSNNYGKLLTWPELFKTFVDVNPNKGGEGWNPPEPLSTAYRFVCDELRSVKPSCIFHFWCLKQVKNINLGGCIKNFSKNLSFEKKNFVVAGTKILKNRFFQKNFTKNVLF